MISASAALTGSYDYNQVPRSVLIAIFASYAALDFTGRVTAARGRGRLAWLSGGAIAMGLGIWAMHFRGCWRCACQCPSNITGRQFWRRSS